MSKALKGMELHSLAEALTPEEELSALVALETHRRTRLDEECVDIVTCEVNHQRALRTTEKLRQLRQQICQTVPAEEIAARKVIREHAADFVGKFRADFLAFIAVRLVHEGQVNTLFEEEKKGRSPVLSCRDEELSGMANLMTKERAQCLSKVLERIRAGMNAVPHDERANRSAMKEDEKAMRAEARSNLTTVVAAQITKEADALVVKLEGLSKALLNCQSVEDAKRAKFVADEDALYQKYLEAVNVNIRKQWTLDHERAVVRDEMMFEFRAMRFEYDSDASTIFDSAASQRFVLRSKELADSETTARDGIVNAQRVALRPIKVPFLALVDEMRKIIAWKQEGRHRLIKQCDSEMRSLHVVETTTRATLQQQITETIAKIWPYKKQMQFEQDVRNIVFEEGTSRAAVRAEAAKTLQQDVSDLNSNLAKEKQKEEEAAMALLGVEKQPEQPRDALLTKRRSVVKRETPPPEVLPEVKKPPLPKVLSMQQLSTLAALKEQQAKSAHPVYGARIPRKPSVVAADAPSMYQRIQIQPRKQSLSAQPPTERRESQLPPLGQRYGVVPAFN